MNRRSFLTACIATMTAPAIVRASSLMPVSVRPQIIDLPFSQYQYVILGMAQETSATIFLPESGIITPLGLGAIYVNDKLVVAPTRISSNDKITGFGKFPHFKYEW